jgi:TldD protein
MGAFTVSQSGQALSQRFHPTVGGFDESWQPMLSVLLGAGRAAGADIVEFFLERRNSLSCAAENGRVSSIEPSLVVGAGIRVFLGAKDCFVSTNDLSFLGLRNALEKALSILGCSFPSPQSFLPEINLEPLRDYGGRNKKNALFQECSPLPEVCSLLLKSNELLKKKVSHLESATANYSRVWQEVLVAASDGVFARDVRLHDTISNGVVCVDGAHRTSFAERDGGTSNPSFLRALDFDSMAVSMGESAGRMLRAEFVSSGTYPIVMAASFGGVIFHEACGHLLETTQIERKTTPFAESKGKMIAHPSVTAWDEGLSQGYFGSIDMDDEGMPAQRTLLIENGVLRNFLSDRGGSLKTGHPRTGSGRRQNYTFAAASRMRNTYIGAGEHTADDIFAATGNGIYCKRMGGGSVGSTGEFNFGVTEAYLIENGKVTKPLKGATLIGTAKDILQRISMCSNDLALSPGFCGSVSGTVFTTVGQPHIKVDMITVGGR